MAGDEEAEAIARAEAAGGAGRPGRAGERGKLAVRHDLARRNRAKLFRAPREERCVVLEVDGHSLERVAIAFEVAAQPRDHFRDEAAPVW